MCLECSLMHCPGTCKLAGSSECGCLWQQHRTERGSIGSTGQQSVVGCMKCVLTSRQGLMHYRSVTRQYCKSQLGKSLQLSDACYTKGQQPFFSLLLAVRHKQAAPYHCSQTGMRGRSASPNLHKQPWQSPYPTQQHDATTFRAASCISSLLARECLPGAATMLEGLPLPA